MKVYRNNRPPLYIQVHPDDNTAIIVNSGGLDEGTEFPCGLKLIERIPQGHKVALRDIYEGEEIVRYGEVIGYAKTTIKKGSWVKESLVLMPTPPKLTSLTFSNKVKEVLPLEEEFTFLGFRNEDGTVGTKNILGITTSVQCVAGVLNVAVKKIKEELLPLFPNVDDVIALNHAYGCGVAINAPDAVIPIRTLQNLARHPNFGGELMIIGLGCEKLSPDRLNNGINDNILILQNENGFMNMINSIMEMAEKS